MKKFLDIMREGFTETPSKLSPESLLQNLHRRRQIERVYEFILDGFSFNDALRHVASHYKVDPEELRELVITDFKDMRHRSDTYASPTGHELVRSLNPLIREALEEALGDKPRLPQPGETPFWIEALEPISRELVHDGWTWTEGGCWAFADALIGAVGGTLCGVCEEDDEGCWGTNHALVLKNGRYYDYTGVVDPDRACAEIANQRGKPQRIMSTHDDGFEVYEDDFLDDEQWAFLHEVLNRLRSPNVAVS